LLLLLVGLYAGLCSIRMIPLFVLIAVPIVSRRLGNWPRTAANPRDSRVAVRNVINATILLAMVSFAALHTARVIQRQSQVEKERFPARAVGFLQAHPPTSPIFNSYDWGGYLIWRLYPSTRVFIDGRTDLYDKQLLDQFADTYTFRGNWSQTLQRWKIGTVLVPTNSALATGLRRCPGWAVAYEDEQAVVLTEANLAGLASMQENTTSTASCRLLCLGIISPQGMCTGGTFSPRGQLAFGLP
jgi:hypothetical protein